MTDSTSPVVGSGVAGPVGPVVASGVRGAERPAIGPNATALVRNTAVALRNLALLPHFRGSRDGIDALRLAEKLDAIVGGA